MKVPSERILVDTPWQRKSFGQDISGPQWKPTVSDVAVDPDAEVTGNWAVYAMYKDAPTEDDTTQNVVSYRWL